MSTHMSWGIKRLIIKTIPSLSRLPTAQTALIDPFNM